MVFNHSIKVPTQYKKAASILKAAFQKKKSLKTLIFEEKHVRMRGVQAVLKHYVDNRGDIDSAIEKSGILEENSRLEHNLCRVLVTELLYGRKQLNGDSRPVETVRSYKEKLLAVIGGEAVVIPKKGKNPIEF